MGRISAVFKADGDETQGGYSISEWWLEPRTQGPGAHAHPEDDVFYVLAGTMSLRVGDDWVHAEAGSFVLVPGGQVHDFENRGPVRAGVLNLSFPGWLRAAHAGHRRLVSRTPGGGCHGGRVEHQPVGRCASIEGRHARTHTGGMTLPTFAAFEAQALADGFDEVLERTWLPNTVLDTHTHPFAARAVVAQGEMWLRLGDGLEQHLHPGDTFALAAEAPHTERYGPLGAVYWVARRTPR